MNDLQTFFTKLAAWEGKPATCLAAPWVRSDALAIASDFRRAFSDSRLAKRPLLVAAGTNNQSAGNRVAEFIQKQLDSRLRHFRIKPCQGPGYPDSRLCCIGNDRSFAMEIKATTSFDPTNESRMVLASASKKLRRSFHGPVCHLLVTACYQRRHRTVWVRALRLDFLLPTTKVNIRLEASVSKRLLSEMDYFLWIGNLGTAGLKARRRRSGRRSRGPGEGKSRRR
jgi:hypothetical protein